MIRDRPVRLVHQRQLLEVQIRSVVEEEGWEVRIHSARRRVRIRLATTLALRRNNNNPVVSVPHQIAIARNKSFLAVENLFVARNVQLDVRERKKKEKNGVFSIPMYKTIHNKL